MDPSIIIGSVGFSAISGIALATTLAVKALKQTKQQAAELTQLKTAHQKNEENFAKHILSMTHMGNRIVELENEASQLKTLIRQLQKPKQVAVGHYHQARRMVDLGGDELDLVKDCGLTRIEAQMIQVLQAKSKSL